MTKEMTRYFISANTERGFYSLYEKVFTNGDFDRIFVIHGGPGTGKSTLMRAVASAVREKGADCTEILCSSDPHSLDGLIIEKNGKKIGVLDGTPPHGRVISEPEVKETLWNVCKFITREKLELHREEIRKHAKEKKDSYQRAYSLLSAAGALKRYLVKKEAENLNEEKLLAHIERGTRALKEEGEAKELFIRAISSTGSYIAPALSDLSENIVLLCGKPESAEIYLSYLSDALKKKKIAHTRFSSPLVPEILDAIFIKESSTLYLNASLWENINAKKRIHMSRFFEKSPTREERKIRRLCEKTVSEAYEALKKAGSSHRALEEIYASAMNFKRMEKTRQTWIADVLSLL